MMTDRQRQAATPEDFAQPKQRQRVRATAADFATPSGDTTTTRVPLSAFSDEPRKAGFIEREAVPIAMEIVGEGLGKASPAPGGSAAGAGLGYAGGEEYKYMMGYRQPDVPERGEDEWFAKVYDRILNFGENVALGTAAAALAPPIMKYGGKALKAVASAPGEAKRAVLSRGTGELYEKARSGAEDLGVELTTAEQGVPLVQGLQELENVPILGGGPRARRVERVAEVEELRDLRMPQALTPIELGNMVQKEAAETASKISDGFGRFYSSIPNKATDTSASADELSRLKDYIEDVDDVFVLEDYEGMFSRINLAIDKFNAVEDPERAYHIANTIRREIGRKLSDATNPEAVDMLGNMYEITKQAQLQSIPDQGARDKLLAMDSAYQDFIKLKRESKLYKGGEIDVDSRSAESILNNPEKFAAIEKLAPAAAVKAIDNAVIQSMDRAMESGGLHAFQKNLKKSMKPDIYKRFMTPERMERAENAAALMQVVKGVDWRNFSNTAWVGAAMYTGQEALQDVQEGDLPGAVTTLLTPVLGALVLRGAVKGLNKPQTAEMFEAIANSTASQAVKKRAVLALRDIGGRTGKEPIAQRIIDEASGVSQFIGDTAKKGAAIHTGIKGAEAVKGYVDRKMEQ